MARKPVKNKSVVAASRPVEGLIHVIRNRKVMADSDLAVLYEVSTRALNQAVQRNHARFPEDFMFRLTVEEAEALTSQLVISNGLSNGNALTSQSVISKKAKKQASGRGGRRYAPYVFTEHGVTMLASVLRSPRAIRTGLAIVRTFVRLREMLATHSELVARLERLEGNQDRAVSVIEALVNDIDRLSAEIDEMRTLPEGTGRRIGFVTGPA